MLDDASDETSNDIKTQPSTDTQTKLPKEELYSLQSFPTPAHNIAVKSERATLRPTEWQPGQLKTCTPLQLWAVHTEQDRGGHVGLYWTHGHLFTQGLVVNPASSSLPPSLSPSLRQKHRKQLLFSVYYLGDTVGDASNRIKRVDHSLTNRRRKLHKEDLRFLQSCPMSAHSITRKAKTARRRP